MQAAVPAAIPTLAYVDEIGLILFALFGLAAAGGSMVFAIIATSLAAKARAKADHAARSVEQLRAELRAAERPAPVSSVVATPTPAGPPAEPKRAALGRLMTPTPPAPEPPTQAVPAPDAPSAPDTEPKPQAGDPTEAIPEAASIDTPTPATQPPAPTPPQPAPTPTPAPAPPADQAPAARWFEELLGAKLFVWVGGVALAAAVAFLLKWTFDQNLITPAVRVIGGAVFGVTLLGAGEWLRTRANVVAQAMSGAGLAALYAVIFAAANLYGFVSHTQGFLLSVAVTALAIALSLRHGVFTAVLGLLGGFVMPILLRTGEPVGGGFFAYLVLLQAGLVAVARHRTWPALSIATLVGGMLWMLLSLVGAFPITSSIWIVVLMLGSAVVFVVQAIEQTDRDAGGTADATLRWVLAMIASASASVMLATHVAVQGFVPRDVWTLVALSAATMALGRIDRRYLLLPWIALGAGYAMLVGWVASAQWLVAPSDIDPAFPGRFTPALIALGVVFWLGGYGCMWKQRRAAVWATMSGVAGAAFSLLAVAALWDVTAPGFAWWAVIAGVTGAMAGLTAVRHFATLPEAPAAPQTDAPTAILATFTAALAAGAIGLACYDQPPWLGIGWAALAVAIAAARLVMRTPALGGAAVGCLGLTAVTLAVAPGPFFDVVGQPVVWNTLLLAYGPPAALLGLTAFILRRASDRPAAGAFEAAAVLTALLGSVWLTRHAFAPHELLADPGMLEAATHALNATLLGLIAYTLSRPLASPALRWIGAALAALGLLGAVLWSGLIFNPLWHTQPVGDAIVFNWLLFLYALPIALAVLAAKLFARLGGEEAKPLATVSGIVALLMAFAWVTLSVRQGFAGPVLDLDAVDVTKPEFYGYSMAWVALGLTLLGLGVWSGSRTLRIGSLVVMLLAVGKVFLFDAAALRDLYRVLSFLGLGLSLMGLGYVYQRWVFKRDPPPAADAST